MIGRKIKKIRKENKMTQDTLALKINVSRQTISSWENNQTYPNLEQLYNLSQLFNISLDELVSNEFTSNLNIKLSNTERMANITVTFFKILLCLVIILLIAFIVDYQYKIKKNGGYFIKEHESAKCFDETGAITNFDFYTYKESINGYYTCTNCDDVKQDIEKKTMRKNLFLHMLK